MRVQTEEIRRRIVNAAYESFWRLGYRRASVDSIAARAGVAKRTVYAYFRSKDDLLAAVLQHYEELAAERLAHIGERMPPDRSGHDPEKCEAVFRKDHAQTRIDFVESFFGQLSGWAAVTPRWSGSGFTRLVVELADLPGHPARAIARRAKAKTESWFAERLSNARVRDPASRARELMLLTEGSMALTLIHGGREYIDAAAGLAKRMMKEGCTQRGKIRGG